MKLIKSESMSSKHIAKLIFDIRGDVYDFINHGSSTSFDPLLPFDLEKRLIKAGNGFVGGNGFMASPAVYQKDALQGWNIIGSHINMDSYRVGKIVFKIAMDRGNDDIYIIVPSSFDDDAISKIMEVCNG